MKTFLQSALLPFIFTLTFVAIGTLTEAAKCKISLIDFTGRLLVSQEVDAVKGKNEKTFNVSRFANGPYFISLFHGQEIKTIVLIKAH